MKTPSILIYGYGNPGRKDDGLGIRFVDEMEKWANANGSSHIHFDANYQLNPEDAVVIAPYKSVLFVDASLENISDFSITKVKASKKNDFSFHRASPGYVVYLCENIYGRIPAVYLLHIKGYEWQLEAGITNEALKNLNKALDFVQNSVAKLSFQEIHFDSSLKTQ